MSRFGNPRLRSRCRRGTTALSLFLAAACGEPPRVPAPEQTPVVLIVIDTMRKDHLSCYGNPRPTSPHIDALAAAGVRFERAYSQAPWTTPSIGSLLSSQFPTSLGIVDERSVLAEELVLLPEALQEAGYATSAVVSHSFCSRRWGFAQGFDQFDESNVLGHQEAVSAGVSDRALEQLEVLKNRPFFLFLHYFDPHFSYLEHEPYSFKDEGYSYRGPVKSGQLFRELLQYKRQLTAADLFELRRIYDSETAWTDRHIGRVLDRLRELDLFERALVILTADHGEEFLDHGELGHAKSLFDELVNVPLIIKFPAHLELSSPWLHSPGVSEEPVGLIDLYPTVIDLLGLEYPPAMRGHSLVDPGRDERKSPRPVFTETSRRNNLRALVFGRHKLIYDVDRRNSQLFDHQDDPEERNNVRHAQSSTAKLLRAKLDLIMESNVPGQFDAGEELLLSAEDQEHLRAMGYLEDE